MIDPRILQQHFQEVQKKEVPYKPEVPQIANVPALTSIQAIFVPPEEPIERKMEIFEQFEEVIPDTVLEEFELVNVKKETNKKEDENPYGYSVLQTEDDYNPYGYYSGPKF